MDKKHFFQPGTVFAPYDKETRLYLIHVKYSHLFLFFNGFKNGKSEYNFRQASKVVNRKTVPIKIDGKICPFDGGSLWSKGDGEKMLEMMKLPAGTHELVLLQDAQRQYGFTSLEADTFVHRAQNDNPNDLEKSKWEA